MTEVFRKKYLSMEFSRGKNKLVKKRHSFLSIFMV